MMSSGANQETTNFGVYDRLVRSKQCKDVSGAVRCIVRGFDYHTHKPFADTTSNFLLMGDHNQFLAPTERDQIRCLYAMGNRVRRVLARFVFRWKWSRATRYEVAEDLAGTPLDTFPADQTICLMENGTLYRFRIADLVRIMDTAMLNVDHDMFANPLPIRNPYTNLSFSKHNLYNIYFAVPQHATLPMSISLLFREEFDVGRTLETWESTFRDLSIRAHANHMSDNECLMHTFEMLEKFDTDALMRLNIACDFPDPIIVATFRPFMYEYLVSEYGYNPDQTHRCFAATGIRIFRFRQANPRFGRKIWLKNVVVSDQEIVREKTLCGKDTGWAWYVASATPDTSHSCCPACSAEEGEVGEV
jgi:hypothetical protein